MNASTDQSSGDIGEGQVTATNGPGASPTAATIVSLARVQLLEFLVAALFQAHPAQGSVLVQFESMLQAHRGIAEANPDECARRVLLAINDMTRVLGQQFQAQQQGAPGLH